jgi:RNA polymerase sigma-70 factor (ECF subfamily)
VSDESTIDDLLHDSFLLIFSKINSVRDVTKAEAWMQKVTQNLSLMYLEQHKLQSVVSFDELDEPLTVAAPATMPITYDEILNLVDSLPNSYQRVFRLSVLEGLSHQEIAALLNIEPHTSSAQLVRAKKKLRQSLTIFLLGLLTLFLPLGLWYALRQPTESPSLPEGNKPTASSRPVPEQRDGGEPTVTQKEKIYSQRGNKKFPTREQPVPNVGTIAEQVTRADSAKTPEEPQRQIQEEMNVIAETPDTPTVSANHHQDWTLALAYSGLNNQRSFNLPYAEYGMNDPEMDTITHHRMPLTIALSFNKMLNNRLSLGTGLQYTQLYSETQAGNTYIWEQSQQRLRYLGIPLRLSWYAVRMPHWTVYGTAQTMMELPLHSTLDRASYVEGRLIDSQHLRLSPSVQWSIGAGIGLEYRLTPVIGIYAEPSLQYFLKTGDGLDTWRTAHPAAFSVPVGIRINIK